jgi:hypothetical protein
MLDRKHILPVLVFSELPRLLVMVLAACKGRRVKPSQTGLAAGLLRAHFRPALACPMSQHAVSEPAERSSMELAGSATEATAPDAAAAAAAAALTGLSAESAAATAAAGQSEAVMTACTPLHTAHSHRMRCSCGLRMWLCRCPAGDAGRRPTRGLGRTALMRRLRQAAESLQGQAA